MSFFLCAGTGPGLLLRLFLVFGTVSVVVDGMNLWPMPKSVNHGSQTLYLIKDFKLRTEGSNYADGLGILQDAFSRMVDIVVASRAVGANLTNSNVLAGIVVEISSSDDTVIMFLGKSINISMSA